MEFLRRFTLHVLPKGLHKSRYFGFLANCHRDTKLTQCRDLLGERDHALVPHATTPSEDSPETDCKSPLLQPGDAYPVCRQGRMVLIETYYRHRAAEDLSVAPPGCDTS